MEIRFKLNPNNTKDKIIIDVLESEYSATDVIKGMLYKVATNGVQWSTMSAGGVDISNIVAINEQFTPQIYNKGNQEEQNSAGEKCQIVKEFVDYFL